MNLRDFLFGTWCGQAIGTGLDAAATGNTARLAASILTGVLGCIAYWLVRRYRVVAR